MAEKAADLFQRVLKKGYGYWSFKFELAVKVLNSRVIDDLGYSPHEVLFGFPSGQVMDRSLPTINKLEIQSFLQLNPKYLDADDSKILAQLNYIANRHQLRQIVLD
ncbi:hypothetical protein GcM1_217032 [Golovinomyces cichoracearum]|uniref:Uncharacterized protein n=1 Tax=Golovinomyces cichoracearum TaxID=62708 RepID=A0A420ISZ7_9PEZI|nr:hypothetical protein GcM1_217032 [Golovinomyces cichoracearum]